MNQRAEQPKDFHKMCKQAERDHEARKLVVLIERVKRQLREREQGSAVQLETPKSPVTAIVCGSSPQTSTRSFFER